MTLPELAIRRHVTTLMLLISLAVLGTVAITRLPLAFKPDTEEPELFVRVPYLSASPEQVERMVVRPLEDALGSVKGLQKMYARCDDDGGMIRLEFSWSTDLALARVEIQEKIDRVRRDLPDDIGDITVNEDWNNRETDDPILEGRLSLDADLSQSYDLLERRLIRPLQRVPGVAQVRLDGVAPREVRINLRLADLELHKVDVRDVSRILRTSNFDQSLGRVVDGERQFVLRTLGAFRSVDEIRQLVIRSDGLRLENVADITYKEPELDFGRHLDGKFAVGFTISQESSANAVEVCDALMEKLQEIQAKHGLVSIPWHNQGEEIKKTLLELLYSGVFGAMLASLVLWVFLRRVLTTFVSVLCIPFSLVVTCGFIWLQGRNLNTLTLLGLIVGVGMLVDNAVVVIENIFRHQELGEGRKEASRKGAREVSTAVIAATLTSVIVFLPIIFNRPSEMSIPMKEIGLTVCMTLLASLFISQTLIPLATSWFIRSKPRPKERWITAIEGIYERLLRFNLRHRWLTPLIGLAIVGSAIYPFLRVDVNFDQERSDLYAQVRYEFSEELSLDRKEQVISRIEALIEPHREDLLAKATYSWWSPSYSMTRVYLKDEHSKEENVALVRERLKKILPEIPGIKLEVSSTRRAWRQNRGKRIAFQLVGEDSAILATLAEEARTRLEQIPGLVRPFADTRQGQEELLVEVDGELATQFGVLPTQVSDRVGLTFRGRRLPKFRTVDGEREMWLALEEQETDTESQLHNLPMWTPAGERVPLAALADFRVTPGPERIERHNRLKSVWVGASYVEGTREDYEPLVRQAVSGLEFPHGYSWTFGDWQSRREEQSAEFLTNLSLALLLVFAVMAGLFESVPRAIALMVALPFAISGAIWTLWLTDTDCDQPAAVGFLLLIGIVVNNGIVMIEHIGAYQRQGLDRFEAMVRGGRERLRPILMTAVTTLIGLLPMVIQRPSLAGTYYYSMAYVIMGGIAVSTFLTAVLLPTTATLIEDLLAWAGKMFRRVPRGD